MGHRERFGSHVLNSYKLYDAHIQVLSVLRSSIPLRTIPSYKVENGIKKLFHTPTNVIIVM